MTDAAGIPPQESQQPAELATTPIASQMAPYKVMEAVGRRFWCACGRSKTQPYCDGTHKTACVGLRSIPVEFAEPKAVAWCGCRLTKTPPFCDGSHKRCDTLGKEPVPDLP